MSTCRCFVQKCWRWSWRMPLCWGHIRGLARNSASRHPRTERMTSSRLLTPTSAAQKITMVRSLIQFKKWNSYIMKSHYTQNDAFQAFRSLVVAFLCFSAPLKSRRRQFSRLQGLPPVEFLLGQSAKRMWSRKRWRGFCASSLPVSDWVTFKMSSESMPNWILVIVA